MKNQTTLRRQAAATAGVLLLIAAWAAVFVFHFPASINEKPHVSPANVAMPTQRMEAILVTAKVLDRVERMEAVLITASRQVPVEHVAASRMSRVAG